VHYYDKIFSAAQGYVAKDFFIFTIELTGQFGRLIHTSEIRSLPLKHAVKPERHIHHIRRVGHTDVPAGRVKFVVQRQAGAALLGQKNVRALSPAILQMNGHTAVFPDPVRIAGNGNR